MFRRVATGAFLLAAVFWWLPGLAHVYNRQWSKAGLYLLIQALPLIILYFAVIAPNGAKGPLGALSVLAIPIAFLSTLFGAFDALFVAKRHQEGRFVGVWTFF